jgi:hypothetical protein
MIVVCDDSAAPLGRAVLWTGNEPVP